MAALSRRTGWIAVFMAAVGAWLVAPPVIAQFQGPVDALPAGVRSTIQALLAEKASRTGPQRKIDSQILYGMRMARRQAIAAGVASLNVDLPTASDGRLIIDVRANVSRALLDRLRTQGIDI